MFSPWYFEQAVEQTVEMSVISDAMVLFLGEQNYFD